MIIVAAWKSNKSGLGHYTRAKKYFEFLKSKDKKVKFIIFRDLNILLKKIKKKKANIILIDTYIFSKKIEIFLKKNFNKIIIINDYQFKIPKDFYLIDTFKFYKKIKSFLSGLIDGITIIFKMKSRNQFIFHSIFIWLMYVLMFYFTSKAFVDLNQVTFFQLTISFTLAALSIMFSNGGIGIYPLAVEESLVWYGVQSATGLAFGWVMWLSQTLMVVIFGGLSLFVLPFINRSKSI